MRKRYYSFSFLNFVQETKQPLVYNWFQVFVHVILNMFTCTSSNNNATLVKHRYITNTRWAGYIVFPRIHSNICFFRSRRRTHSRTTGVRPPLYRQQLALWLDDIALFCRSIQSLSSPTGEEQIERHPAFWICK